MILDYENMFAKGQAVTVTAVSANVVALGPEAGDGAGRKIVIAVTEDFVGLTSLAVALQTDSVEAMSSLVTVLTTQAFALAELKAGFVIEIPIPSIEMEDFARLNFVVVGTASAGKLDAGIVLDTQTNG